jgi:hypothetical protein
MDAQETHELAERVSGEDRPVGEGFRRRAALAIGVMAMLLAIAGLGGENAMKETINANIKAADAYAFYQARNVRQDIYAGTAQTLELLGKDPAPYRARAERESAEKAKLFEEASRHDDERATAQRRDVNFDYVRALYEIAIVLGSVSIVASSRLLIALAGALAAAATALSLNGYLLLV